MGISSKVQIIMQKVMLSRLSIVNTNKVIKILSSNICEHYFATLAKSTEGKRMSIGKGIIG